MEGGGHLAVWRRGEYHGGLAGEVQRRGVGVTYDAPPEEAVLGRLGVPVHGVAPPLDLGVLAQPLHHVRVRTGRAVHILVGGLRRRERSRRGGRGCRSNEFHRFAAAVALRHSSPGAQTTKEKFGMCK